MPRDISVATLVGVLPPLSTGRERKPESKTTDGGSAQVAADDGHGSHEGHVHSLHHSHAHDEMDRDERASHDHSDNYAHDGAPQELGTLEIAPESPEARRAVLLIVRNAAGAEPLTVKGQQGRRSHV